MAALPLQLWILSATLLVVGVVVLRLVVLPRWREGATVLRVPDLAVAESVVRGRVAACGAIAAALGALGAVLRLLEQAAAVGQGALTSDTGALAGFAAAFPVGALLGTPWGAAWMAQTLAFVAAAVTLGRARRAERDRVDSTAWRLAAVAAVAVAAAPAWLGHAAADETCPWLAVASDTLHVAGAGVWLGTLAVLVGVAVPALAHLPPPARTPALLALVRAFTPVALVGVTALAASGVASTALRLAPAWTGGLRWTGLGVYGWVLGAKLAAVLPTAALGFWHWRRAAPRLAAAPPGEAAPAAVLTAAQAFDDGEFAALPPTSRRIAQSMTAEVVLAAVVLVATALLVATPPPAPPDPFGTDVPAAEP